MPRISVLMPTFNQAEHLKESIQSILNQSFSDFEFIIINDGSTDNSEEIIKSFSDERIRYYKNETNLNLANCLNLGLDMAQGEYMARMDADDISLPQRLEKQIKFLESNPDIGICGTWVKTFGYRNMIVRHPTRAPEIKCKLFLANAFAHPTIILRKKILDKYNLRYNGEFERSQDYELWIRCAKYFKLANLGEVLLLNRSSETKSQYYESLKYQRFLHLIDKNQLDELGVNYDEDELQLHHLIKNGNYPSNQKQFIANSYRWLSKIKRTNKINRIYPEPIFHKVINEKFTKIIFKILLKKFKLK